MVGSIKTIYRVALEEVLLIKIKMNQVPEFDENFWGIQNKMDSWTVQIKEEEVKTATKATAQ